MTNRAGLLSLLTALLLLLSLGVQAFQGEDTVFSVEKQFVANSVSGLDKPDAYWRDAPQEEQAKLLACLLLDASDWHKDLMTAFKQSDIVYASFGSDTQALGLVVLQDDVSHVVTNSESQGARLRVKNKRDTNASKSQLEKNMVTVETSRILAADDRLASWEWSAKPAMDGLVDDLTVAQYPSTVVGPLKKSMKTWLASAKSKASLAANLLIEAEERTPGIIAAFNKAERIYVMQDAQKKPAHMGIAFVADGFAYALAHVVADEVSLVMANQVGFQESMVIDIVTTNNPYFARRGFKTLGEIKKAAILTADERLANWGN